MNDRLETNSIVIETNQKRWQPIIKIYREKFLLNIINKHTSQNKIGYSEVPNKRGGVGIIGGL